MDVDQPKDQSKRAAGSRRGDPSRRRPELEAARARVKKDPGAPDEFDEQQDTVDERCEASLTCSELSQQLSCACVVTCPLGDANRLACYVRDMYADVHVLHLWDMLVAFGFDTPQHRDATLRKMYDDEMLKKKADRWYPIDHVLEWAVDWPMRVCETLKLSQLDASHVFRVMSAPRKLEQEMVYQVDEMHQWKGLRAPAFAPQKFTHGVSVVEFELEQRKFVGFALFPGDLMYLKSSTDREDKTCRAYYKLLEAITRFRVPLSSGTKALDVGASPGGWTQYLVENGLEVYSVDPAPLTLSQELMQHVHWIDGLSNSPQVLQRLRDAAPFSIIVCDMNQMPDELARSFDPLIPLLAPGGYVVVTIKLSHLRPEQRAIRRYAKGSQRFLNYFRDNFPKLKQVGNIKWLLQNKNERCAVFRNE